MKASSSSWGLLMWSPVPSYKSRPRMVGRGREKERERESGSLKARVALFTQPAASDHLTQI